MSLGKVLTTHNRRNKALIRNYQKHLYYNTSSFNRKKNPEMTALLALTIHTEHICCWVTKKGKKKGGK